MIGAEQFSELSSDQAAGIAGAIAEDPGQVLEMPAESVTAMVSTMEASDLGALGSDMVGTMMAGMDAEQLGGMSADHMSEAMETMGADLMGEGAVDFTEIESATTFLDEAPVETPSALSDMMQAEGASSFFGSALFGQS